MDEIKKQEIFDKISREAEENLLNYGFDSINVVPNSYVPTNYLAYLQIAKYIQSTSKIYSPERFVDYFTTFTKSLKQNLDYSLWNSFYLNKYCLRNVASLIYSEDEFSDLQSFWLYMEYGININSKYNYYAHERCDINCRIMELKKLLQYDKCEKEKIKEKIHSLQSILYKKYVTGDFYLPTFKKDILKMVKYDSKLINFFPYEIIEYHFPVLIEKCPEVDLKPFFKYQLDEFKEKIELCDFNHISSSPLDPCSYNLYVSEWQGKIEEARNTILNHAIFLMFCMKKYPKYFSEEDKNIIREYFFKFRTINLGEWSLVAQYEKYIPENFVYKPGGNNFIKKDNRLINKVLLTSSFSLTKKASPETLGLVGIFDYMDLWLDFKEIDVLSYINVRINRINEQAGKIGYRDLFKLNIDSYERSLFGLDVDYSIAKWSEKFFWNMKNNFYLAYLSFIFCLQFDREHISEYVDFVVRIDCPIVAYNFIKKLYNELTEDDIYKIMELLAFASPKLFNKAKDIIKNSQTDTLTSEKPNNESVVNGNTRVRKKVENLNNKYDI